MCLATAYGKKDDENKMLCKNVTRVFVDGRNIKIETLLGDTIEIEGAISFIDLMESKVVINCD